MILFSYSRILTVSTCQVDQALHLFHSMSRKITRIPQGVFTIRKSGTTDNEQVKRKTKQTTLDIKPICHTLECGLDVRSWNVG
jgi:hypothetical protein